MYVQVVTIDGKKKTVLNLSKLTKIRDLKKDIEDEFDIPKDKQALFFRGKHLEDDCTIYDYSINLNNVIQVMIKTEQNGTTLKTPPPSTPEKDKKPESSSAPPEEEQEIDASSNYYKVNDAVDCTDTSLGAWYEGLITKIFTKQGKLHYRIKWDVPDSKDDEPFDVSESDIRPRAWRVLNFDDLELGQRVMLNYNLENPKEVGIWYDFKIAKIVNTRSQKELTGTIYIGDGSQSVENCKVVATELDIYAIEKPVLLEERDEALVASRVPKTRRRIPVKCAACQDDPKSRCRECSCTVCGRKNDPHLTLLCDECNTAYHMACLKPPMKELPAEDDWYCPECKVDKDEIVKVGEKMSVKKKHSKVVGTTRDWGKGMACVGRTKVCTIVPKSHRGHIPGIEVGTLWKFRVQVSESGIHRPHVAGIHGQAGDCAYSIVLSGGYEDDVDNGEEFLYTGSGGRDLSGNKRTAKQSCDQQLTLMNRALATNCNAPINAKEGAEAKSWRKGVPIRVVRNYKLGKHSKYAPEEGNRYDGIYKVVKYWPEKGQSGFRVWRYLLRRDDPTPAPWTDEGRKRSRELRLVMTYPEGYEAAQEKKNAVGAGTKRKAVDENKEVDEEVEKPSKKRKLAASSGFKLSGELKKLMERDERNAKLWQLCNDEVARGKQAYFEKVSAEFACVVCQELVHQPVTTPCAHNICKTCLKRSFAASTYACPMCRAGLAKGYDMKVNEELAEVLLMMFPGYEKTR